MNGIWLWLLFLDFGFRLALCFLSALMYMQWDYLSTGMTYMGLNLYPSSPWWRLSSHCTRFWSGEVEGESICSGESPLPCSARECGQWVWLWSLPHLMGWSILCPWISPLSSKVVISPSLIWKKWGFFTVLSPPPTSGFLLLSNVCANSSSAESSECTFFVFSEIGKCAFFFFRDWEVQKCLDLQTMFFSEWTVSAAQLYIGSIWDDLLIGACLLTLFSSHGLA